MQNQEQHYEEYEQAAVNEYRANTDQREQGQQQQAGEGFRPYGEGYGGKPDLPAEIGKAPGDCSR